MFILALLQSGPNSSLSDTIPVQNQSQAPAPVTSSYSAAQSTNSKPQPQALKEKESYETRDLSKLIQKPFAVTGGPVSLEQRKFIQSLPNANQQQQLSQMRDPLGPAARQGLIEAAVRPSTSTAPTLAKPLHQPRKDNPERPVERVARQVSI